MQENSLCFSDGYLEMRDLNAGFRFKVLKRGQNTPATNEVFDQRSARHVRGASAEPVYGVAAEGLDVLIQPPRAVRDNVIGDKNGAVWSRKAAASRMPVTRRFMVQTIAALRKRRQFRAEALERWASAHEGAGIAMPEQPHPRRT